MTRAVLYCRVSTDEQGKKGYSLPDQLATMRAHAEREGWRVVEEIQDDGYSGGTPDRPGWRRVLELAEAAGIDVVLAAKRDRFFRSRLYRLLTEKDLAEAGVRMVALNDTGNRLADGFQDDFAEYEKDQIRERTRTGIVQKARQGKVIRSSFRPYGFLYSDDGDRLVVETGEMAVVVRLFRGLAEGRTGRSVTQEFEEEGIPSPAGLPRWNQRTVANILRSDLYRPLTAAEVSRRVTREVAATLDDNAAYGLWIYGKRGEGGPVAVPVDLSGSGLDRTTVDAAREHAENRARKPSTAGGRFWVLKGVLRCQECGSAISPHTVKRYLKDGSPGKDSHYYQCRQKYHDGPRSCGNISNFPAEPIEQAVWDEVHELIRAPRRLQATYKEELERRRNAHRQDPAKEARKLAGRLVKIDDERAGYQRLAARDSVSDDELDAALSRLATEKREAEEALEEARGRAEGLESLRRELHLVFARSEQIRCMELRFLNPEDKRKILMASGTKADINREGNVTITGLLNLDVSRLLPTDGIYRTDREAPEPAAYEKGVVNIGNVPSASSA